MNRTTALLLSCALAACAVPADAHLSQTRAVAIANEACMGKKHSDKKPNVTLGKNWWSVTWAPAEGSNLYPVADVDDKTGESKGCVYFSTKPHKGPIPADAKPD